MFTKLNSLKLAICSALALSCSAMSFRAAGADEVRALGATRFLVLTATNEAKKDRCAFTFADAGSGDKSRLTLSKRVLELNKCNEALAGLWERSSKQSTLTYYTLASTNDVHVADNRNKNVIIASEVSFSRGKVTGKSSRSTTAAEETHFAGELNRNGCPTGNCPRLPAPPPPPAAQPSGPTLGTCPNSQTACGLSNGSQLCCKPGENCRPPTKANMHGKCEPANCDSNRGETKCSDNTGGNYSWCCGKDKICGDKNQRCKDRPEQDPTKDTKQPTQPPNPPAPPTANPNPPNVGDVDKECGERLCKKANCANGLVCDPSGFSDCKLVNGLCNCKGVNKCVAGEPGTTCPAGSEQCKHAGKICLTPEACRIATLSCGDIPPTIRTDNDLASCQNWYGANQDKVYKDCLNFHLEDVCKFYKPKSPVNFCRTCLKVDPA